MLGSRARSEGVSALSRGEDQDAPACFSGESNDSHVERVTSHVSPLCCRLPVIAAAAGLAAVQNCLWRQRCTRLIMLVIVPPYSSDYETEAVGHEAPRCVAALHQGLLRV